MMNNDPEIQNLPEGIKKEPPFSVPEGYFESFSSRLMERIEKERKPEIFEKPYRSIRTGLAIAATLAALIIGGYALIKLSQNNGNKSEPVQEFADIIDYYIYDFDDETIMTVFNEETDLNYLNNIYKEEELVKYLSEDDNIDYTELQVLY
jgi:hypothetical protein